MEYWSDGVMKILGDPIDGQIWISQQIPKFNSLLQSENQHSNLPAILSAVCVADCRAGTPPLHYSGLIVMAEPYISDHAKRS